MKPYENKCLIIIVVISIFYLFLHLSKKETFENLDSFIKSTNNGNWNFASYNPYSDLHNFSDVFYIINDKSENDLEKMSYNERLKYNKDNLSMLNTNSNNKLLIEKILNKYNDSTNNVSIQTITNTKFGLAFNYRVLLINAFDKLNYVKNKAKLKSLINTSLIKDIKLYYINKYIENLSITNEYDADDNIVVELKYKLTDIVFNTSGNMHDRDYVTHILNEIKKYLKMDIINNGTSDSVINPNEIHYKFKIIAYKLDENEKQIVNDNITKLYKNLFTEVLNKNDTFNILKKLVLPPDEQYVRNICVWKSGLCSTSTNVKIMPNCSVPNGANTKLKTYKIQFNNSVMTGDNYCDSTKKATRGTNIQDWKKHIIGNINNSIGYNRNIKPCNIYDINYNINGNEYFELNIYENELGIGTNRFIIPEHYPTSNGNHIGAKDFQCFYNIVRTDISSCPTDGSVTSVRTNLDDYMKKLGKIKGLNIATQNNVKAIMLAEQTLEDFTNYKRGKSRQDVMELDKLRLYGKIFKLLDEYKTIEKIDSSIKTKLDSMEESSNEITKDKLYAVLHLIMERHLREKNEEFKLTELLLINNNTTTKKRYEIIMDKIPETDESKLLKLRYMTTTEKVNYFDKSDSKVNKINLELEIILKMTNEEVSIYFKEINELYTNKDVNYRLKRIIDSNKNNIKLVHKKLNSLSGGLVKTMKGGSIVPPGSFSESVGVGTTLLLNEYSDLSISGITSNINDLVYYKDSIYVVGNSGYFAKYDLKTKQWNSLSVAENKYTNLNSIDINQDGFCIIVGDNGTIIYSSDKTTENYPKTFLYKSDITEDLSEVVINKNKENIYIVGKGIKIVYTKTSDITHNNFDGTSMRMNIIKVPTSNYFNIFQNINTGENGVKYCCLNLNNSIGIGSYYIDYLDKNLGNYKNPLDLSQFSIIKPNTKSIYIHNNINHNIIVHHNNNSLSNNKIEIGILDISNKATIQNVKTYDIINNAEKIDAYYVNNTNVGLITDKLNYYQCNDTVSTTMSLKLNNTKNISNSKIVQITPLRNNYTDIYHFGSGGRILNYNINNKHTTDLKLKLGTSGAQIQIVPNLNGVDEKGNNVYIVNGNEKNYQINTTTFTDWEDKTIRLEGNNNSLLIDNTNNHNEDNIKLLRFNYSVNKDEVDNTQLYSVLNNGNKIPLDITKPIMVSKKINIRVDRNKKRNKQEFVSLALIVNDIFKVWLKPENKSDIYEFNYDFIRLDNKNKYTLVKYRNGSFVEKYELKTVNITSTKISNILYEGIDKRFDKNTNTLYLDDIIKKEKYKLLVIPESDKSYIVYDTKQIGLNETFEIEKKQKKINVGIRNGSLFENHIININYGQNKKITELKDYESEYLLGLLIDEAFEYLNNINNTNRTLQFLLKKYRLNKKDEVQEFLGLFTDKNKKETIEHDFVNKLNDIERIDYIKNYLNKDKPVKKVKKVKKEVKTEKVDTIMVDLKVKLDKMKIEKEILANQFKIEQRNRLFEKGESIVSKDDIAKIDSRISNINSMISESRKNKSKSFFDKILGFFSTDEEEDKTVEETLKKIEDAKINTAIEESDKKLKKMADENKLKLEKLQKENQIKMNKIKEENNIKLKEQDDVKKQNELLIEQEKNKLELKKNDTELKNDKFREDANKDIMADLFDVQKTLLKKQKSLLKINNIVIEDNTLIEDNNNNVENKEYINKNNSKKYKKTSEKNKIIKMKLSDKIEEEEINSEEKLIEKSILDEIENELNNEKIIKKKKIHKEKKPCVSFMDCYFKGLDDNFYTSYKNDYTFIKNAELPKEKKPVCKPKNDCEICYLNTSGVPESINYNPKAKNTMVNMPKNKPLKDDINSPQKMENELFKNNYEDLPDCPFDTCMSCDNNNKYKTIDNAFSDNLIEKYRVDK